MEELLQWVLRLLYFELCFYLCHYFVLYCLYYKRYIYFSLFSVYCNIWYYFMICIYDGSMDSFLGLFGLGLWLLGLTCLTLVLGSLLGCLCDRLWVVSFSELHISFKVFSTVQKSIIELYFLSLSDRESPDTPLASTIYFLGHLPILFTFIILHTSNFSKAMRLHKTLITLY